MSTYSSRGGTLATATTIAVMVLSGCGDTITNGGTAPTESASSTANVDYDSVTDTSVLRNLMAISTHVFSGRVDGLAGSQALGADPETQYDVTTGLAVKGEVAQSVIVNQQGGTRDGVYISVNGDIPLQEGQWYLFATRSSRSKGWFTVIPVNGDVKITEQQALDPSSAPLASATEALENNPQGRLIVPPTSSSPTLTFPIPTPGGEYPPPPSPPQPTR